MSSGNEKGKWVRVGTVSQGFPRKAHPGCWGPVCLPRVHRLQRWPGRFPKATLQLSLWATEKQDLTQQRSFIQTGSTAFGFAVCGALFRVLGTLQWPLSRRRLPRLRKRNSKNAQSDQSCVFKATPTLGFSTCGWARGQRREGSEEPTGPGCSSGSQSSRGAPPRGWSGGAGPGEQALPPVVLCAGTPLLRPAPQRRQLHCGLSVSHG